MFELRVENVSSKYISIINVKSLSYTFFNFGLSQPLFLILIFHQFSKTIQYYLVIICTLVMMPYPHCWWFPQLRSSPISRARMTHCTREHRRRESVVSVVVKLFDLSQLLLRFAAFSSLFFWFLFFINFLTQFNIIL